MERYYLMALDDFKGWEEGGRMGGELCVCRTRGVGSAWERRGNLQMRTRFSLEGRKVCPTHPFMSPGPQSDRLCQQ